MKKPVISVVIPTYCKSGDILEIPLKSLAEQRCPRNYFEVIIADNNGGERVKSLAKKYKARIVKVSGKPSQLCRQINKGASVAKGEYILLEDHDIELESDFIGNFAKMVKIDKADVDAWFVPYKIISDGKLLTKIRNFEEEFYKGTVIAAPRLIKRRIFSVLKWDPRVSAGAPDWDYTIQMQLKGYKFGYCNNYFIHHEEQMNFWQLLTKKTTYNEGGEVYKNKWRKLNPKIYKTIVFKQYDPLYRLFGIFFENGKWKKLILQFHLYCLFLAIKVTMAFVYLYNLKVQKGMYKLKISSIYSKLKSY